MNKSDILSIARQQLSDAISNFQTPTCNPLQVSPWIAMSLLQKAIRRGRKNLALRAAGKRFCTCRLSAFRAMNVILQGDGSPYGVLEVDSRSEGEFSQNDIAFLQGAANILGMAIEQQQYQRKLQAALDRHQVLLREVNHRVKNSLQVVSSMLQLQANAVGDQNLSERLNEAASRVNAVGRAYERLAYTRSIIRNW